MCCVVKKKGEHEFPCNKKTKQTDMAKSASFPRTRIVVHASDLAAVAGMHEFKEQEDAVRELLQGHRFGKRAREEARAETHFKEVTEEEVVSSARSMGLDVARPVEEVKRDVVRRVEERAKRVAKRMAADGEGEDGKEGSGGDEERLPAPLREVASRHVGMARGTEEEGSILSRAARCDPHLSTAIRATTKSVDVGECQFGRIVVRGVADAVDANGKFVVEIKRRRNRLFHSIPVYERVQVEAYMRLYGMLDAVLVESFAGEEMDMHWVERDDDLWDDVVLSVQTALDEVV